MLNFGLGKVKQETAAPHHRSLKNTNVANVHRRFEIFAASWNFIYYLYPQSPPSTLQSPLSHLYVAQ